jgi:hypothetical protein
MAIIGGIPTPPPMSNVGNGFELTDKKRPLLIGGGVGMPPMIAIAQQIKDKDCQPFTILGSEVPFPPYIPQVILGKVRHIP